jgi:TfoX/Sxy family transcriptional regulator of competence genes
MKWEKPSAEIINTFEKIVPVIAGVERRKMFGLPCVFVNSNMFMGVHQDNIILRLSKSDRELFLKLEGAKAFEPQPGRIMKEYAVFPEWILKPESTDILNDWIYKSFEYAAALPPKEKKKK